MARRRMDTIRRTDRTYYFIRPPDVPSVPRRQARVKIDYDRELRDLANKGLRLFRNARRVQCGRPTAQTMRLKHVQHAIAYLRKFERRLMKCVDDGS